MVTCTTLGVGVGVCSVQATFCVVITHLRILGNTLYMHAHCVGIPPFHVLVHTLTVGMHLHNMFRYKLMHHFCPGLSTKGWMGVYYIQ